MTLFAVEAHKVYAFDLHERDTVGFSVWVQIGPLVFEWWVSVRTRKYEQAKAERYSRKL